MVALGTLWLPILVSAVLVYIASSIVWMLLPHHKSDWAQLPGEAGVLEAMRRAGVGRGQYRFPFCDPRDKSPETKKKMEEGPMGTMIVWPPGPMGMAKQLGTWFARQAKAPVHRCAQSFERYGLRQGVQWVGWPDYGEGQPSCQGN